MGLTQSQVAVVTSNHAKPCKSSQDVQDDEVKSCLLDKQDIMCSICHSQMTKPVMNVYCQTYCLSCVNKHYKSCLDKWNLLDYEKKLETPKLTDPLTNQKIPNELGSLLIPNYLIQFNILRLALDEEENIKNANNYNVLINEYNKYSFYMIEKYHKRIVNNLKLLMEFGNQFSLEKPSIDTYYLPHLSNKSMNNLLKQCKFDENVQNDGKSDNTSDNDWISMKNVSQTIVDSFKYLQRTLFLAKDSINYWNNSGMCEICEIVEVMTSRTSSRVLLNYFFATCIQLIDRFITII